MRPMAARGCHCTLCHGLSEEEERKGEWNSDTQVIRCCGERVFFEMEKWKRPPGWKENVSFSLYFFPCSNTIQPYIDWMVFWAALPIITHLSFKLLFYFFHFSRSCVQHIMEFAFTRCTSKRHFLNEFVSTKYWSAFIQYCTCSNPQVIAAVSKMHATFLWLKFLLHRWNTAAGAAPRAYCLHPPRANSGRKKQWETTVWEGNWLVQCGSRKRENVL